MIAISLLRMNISDFFRSRQIKFLNLGLGVRFTENDKFWEVGKDGLPIGSSCTIKLNKTMAMQVDLELKKVSKIKYSLYGKKIDLTFTLPIYL